MLDLVSQRVLVTGGTGFLGRHLVGALKERGAQVTPVSSTHADLRRHEDVYRLLAAHAPTLVIHAAGSVGGIGYNQSHPATLFYDNLLMGVHLIDACSWRHVTKLVLIGTACSYPAETPAPFAESHLWDGYPEPTNAPYGIAKRALVTMAQAYRAQYQLNAITVIPTNLYGEGDHFETERSHVIPALVRKFAEAVTSGAESVTVWGTGTASRDFLYVQDAARGIVQAAQQYDAPEPINLGSGTPVRIRDLAALIAQEVGYSGRIVYDDQQPDGQRVRAVSSDRARTAFGFTASTPLAVGLRRVIADYRERRRDLLAV